VAPFFFKFAPSLFRRKEFFFFSHTNQFHALWPRLKKKAFENLTPFVLKPKKKVFLKNARQ
jgi:hypothetical protein